MEDLELNLLSEEDIFGDKDGKGQLDVINKYGISSAITDLVILTGGYCDEYNKITVPDDTTLRGRTGLSCTRTAISNPYVRGVYENGTWAINLCDCRHSNIRPVLLSSNLFSQISRNRMRGYNGTEEVEYGEYPQYAPDSDMQQLLESEYKKRYLNQKMYFDVQYLIDLDLAGKLHHQLYLNHC